MKKFSLFSGISWQFYKFIRSAYLLAKIANGKIKFSFTLQKLNSKKSKINSKWMKKDDDGEKMDD